MRPKRYYRQMDRAKAEWAREQYFSRRLKQWQIAQILGIQQHSVSRIVSGQVWA